MNGHAMSTTYKDLIGNRKNAISPVGIVFVDDTAWSYAQWAVYHKLLFGKMGIK